MQYVHLRGVGRPIIVIHIFFAMLIHLLNIGGQLLLVHALGIILDLFIVASTILLLQKAPWSLHGHKELFRPLLSRETKQYNRLLALLSQVVIWIYQEGDYSEQDMCTIENKKGVVCE